MTLGAVNRRIKGIDIGILGISEETARNLAALKLPNENNSLLSPASPASLDRMVNFMLQKVQDNKDIEDIKEGPMNKILREARSITPEEREKFIRDSLVGSYR
tara:strand:+ start:2017 stop:2325 length:309 start_codon:yes stop_codon:yes gene_type:complete